MAQVYTLRSGDERPLRADRSPSITMEQYCLMSRRSNTLRVLYRQALEHNWNQIDSYHFQQFDYLGQSKRRTSKV